MIAFRLFLTLALAATLHAAAAVPLPAPHLTATWAPRTEREVPIQFSFRPAARQTGITEVTVVGDFNRWNAYATPLARGADGVFRATVPVRAGAYQWRFVINGAWVHDMEAIAAQCGPRPEAYAEHASGGRNARNTAR